MTGVTVRYGVFDSPLGKMLVVATQKGICQIALADEEEELINLVLTRYKSHIRDEKGLEVLAQKVISLLKKENSHKNLPLDINITSFQERVYAALKKIPYGTTLAYKEVASAVNMPRAYRAVARACATNPVALIIPCHRVISSDGKLGGYRWGIERKEVLLRLEKEQG
jgi:AraC family transcriptional regulator of adaptative response/methylated-DNA-[protein]-cysteine methyltransferase